MIKIIKTQKVMTLFMSFIVLMTFNSCKVTFVPSYDSLLSSQIENTSKLVDKFYLQMIENPKSDINARKFEKYINQYIEIEVEINSLLNKNKIKPLNNNSIRICEITLELWLKYKEEHRKDNELSEGIIKLNRKTFNDLFFAMQVAEKGKDLVNNQSKNM
jgi:hypothetical protein